MMEMKARTVTRSRSSSTRWKTTTMISITTFSTTRMELKMMKTPTISARTAV